ncbi:MAG: Uma2 family endonuclease [Cyanobacteria bacterium P01_G01_bin.54]
MIQALSQTFYSPAEYLAFEVESPERHEYIEGEIVPMTGGTPNHNCIALSLASELRLALKRQPYTVFMTDQRLSIPLADIYTYPDVMVLAEPIELVPNRKDTVVNPLLVAEVLSPSTQGYDRGKKFSAYRTIESLQEYLLIDQSAYRVEQYVKTEPRKWWFIEHSDVEAVIEISTLKVQIAMADLYEKVQFEDEGE